MKQFRPCVNLNFYLICIVLGLSVAISGYGRENLKGKPTNSSATPAKSFDIHGVVIDKASNYSPKLFDRLEPYIVRDWEKEFKDELKKKEPPEEFKEYLRISEEMYKGSPVSNFIVIAQGESVRKKTVTDSEGKFKFSELPEGEYKLLAEMSPGSSETGAKQIIAIPEVTEVALFETNQTDVEIIVRSDLFSVRGRIKDEQGQSVVGAKVCGEPSPSPDSGELMKCYPTRFAASGPDGSYELNWFVPPDLDQITGYLLGGNPTFNNRPFYVKVYVKANGFAQDKANVPNVPLVTEEFLLPARRFLNIEKKLQTLLKGRSDKVEKKDIYLPASHGNTITGIDIVLKKAGDVGP